MGRFFSTNWQNYVNEEMAELYNRGLFVVVVCSIEGNYYDP